MKRKYSYLILIAMFLMLINIGYQVIYVPTIKDEEITLVHNKLYMKYPAAYYDERTGLGISGCAWSFDSSINCLAFKEIGPGIEFSTQKTNEYNYEIDIKNGSIWVEEAHKNWIHSPARPSYNNYNDGGLQVIGY